MMLARSLRLGRIDDDFDCAVIDDFPYLDHVRFEGSDGPQRAISDFATSIYFWKNYDHGLPIDLVCSDVKFQDPGSPISSIGDGHASETPNGLMYLTPFAAIARVTGRPLGIGIHTADAGHWENRLRKENPRAVQDMSLIAAHTIAQLAAIRGDGAPKDVNSAWRYLSEMTHGSRTFRDGIKRALQDFRRQLAKLRVLPNDWQVLATWCADNCVRIEAGESVFLDAKNDIGLPFVLADGTRDCVSLRSLFADTELYGLDFSFENSPLSASSFDPAASAIEGLPLIGEDGAPLFGVLIDQCRATQDIYRHASDVVRVFPHGECTTSNLTIARKQHDWPHVSVALGILLADIEIGLSRAATWRRLYQEQGWDPEGDRFVDDHMKLSLNEVVRRVRARFAGEKRATRYELEAVLDEVVGCEEPKTAGVDRIISCLKDTGFLTHLRGTSYSLDHGVGWDRIPSCPKRLPDGAIDCLVDGEHLGKARNDILLARFGFDPAHGANPINRIICELTSERTPSLGAAYLARFRSGGGEPWIKALGRQFAGTISDNEKDWPESIRH